MEWNHQFVETNGIRMHMVRHGAGAPVVLLHGWPEFWYAWRKNIPTLAETFDVIAPDLRGFGQTDKPAGAAAEAYTLDHHVEDLKGLVDALGLARIGIVSHDVGSSVAQAFARRYPDRVAGLFFFNVLYPGVASRLAGPENMPETWYQGFHQQPWAAELIGSSRDATRIYFGNMLSHWAHDPRAFDDDLEAWVDNFLAPGNLQGGFNRFDRQANNLVRADLLAHPHHIQIILTNMNTVSITSDCRLNIIIDDQRDIVRCQYRLQRLCL